MCAKKAGFVAPAAAAALPRSPLRRQLSDEGKKMFLEANEPPQSKDTSVGAPVDAMDTSETNAAVLDLPKKKKKKKKKQKFSDLMGSITAPTRTISQEKRDHKTQLQKMTGGGTFGKLDKI
jgi:hypothetical protein